MAEKAGLIYKILSVADWEAAQRAGRFEGSADDRRDGFIHFSDGEAGRRRPRASTSPDSPT